MNANTLVFLLEKYAFVIVVLFCFGFFAPDLTPKAGMMANDSASVTEKMSGSNLKKQVFWLFLFSFFMWRFLQHNIFTKHKLHMLGILIFMSGGLALISSLWSEYPALTIKRAFFQVVFCFTVVNSFYFAHKHDVVEKSLFLGGTLIVGLIAFTILTGVAFQSGGNLAGFSAGKNLLGQNLVVFIALLVLQIKLFGQRLPYTHWLIAVLFLFLLLTVSKTSISLVIFFLLIGHTHLFITKSVTNTVFALSLITFIFIPPLSYYLGDYIHVGLYLEPDAITGRGIIWDTLYYDLQYFSKLLFGYGYGAYFSNGTVPHFFDDDWSFLKHITSPHNGYLDILIQYGIAFSLVLVPCLYKLTSGIKHSWLSAAFLIPVVYNLTESAFLRDQSMMWCLAVILLSYVVIMKEENIKIKQIEDLNELHT